VPLRLRRCDTDTAWSQAAGIKAGDFVAAIISAANCDPRVFTQPLRFWPYGPSAAPGPPAPRRNLDDYLLFGVKGSNKECWGRERVALPILKGCMAAAARLQGLRRVAGPDGEPQTLVGVKIGLKARFTRVAPVSSPA
jgi:cytochrome P450